MIINHNVLSEIIKELASLFDDYNLNENNHLYLSERMNCFAKQTFPIDMMPNHYPIFALYLLTKFKKLEDFENSESMANAINNSGILPLGDSRNFIMLKQGDIFQYIPYVDAMILFYAPNRCGFIGDLDYLDGLCQAKKIERLKYDAPSEPLNESNPAILTHLRESVRKERHQAYFHYKVTLYSNHPIFCKTTNLLVVNTQVQDRLLCRKTNHGEPTYNRIYHTLQQLYNMVGRCNVNSLALSGILCRDKANENELAQPMVDALTQFNETIERIVLTDNSNIFQNIYSRNFEDYIELKGF